jgi:hypothetical protein
VLGVAENARVSYTNSHVLATTAQVLSPIGRYSLLFNPPPMTQANSAFSLAKGSNAPVMLTGEMIYPFYFDCVKQLQPFKVRNAAQRAGSAAERRQCISRVAFQNRSAFVPRTKSPV